MGLDTVELVMEIEDEFEVSIPDAVAAELSTPGQVAEYLVNALGGRMDVGVTGVCPTARPFYRLRQELQARYATPRASIRPDAAVGGLVPRERRRDWPKIADAAGLRREPNILFRSQVPPIDTSLRDLIKTRRKAEWRCPDGSVDADAVLRRVRMIVADATGVPIDRVGRDSHFINDLGMG